MKRFTLSVRAFAAIAIMIACPELPAQTTWRHAINAPVLNYGGEGKWDDGSVLWPSVIKDGDTLRMWYAGSDELLGLGTVSIGYAWSLNGLAWHRSARNPMLSATRAWEGRSVVCPAVIKESGIFKMWYGANGVPPRVIGYATSTNGVTWEKYPTPVLELGVSEEWDDSVIGPGTIRKEGELYKMWYWGGKEAWPLSVIQIGLATSHDGILWKKHDEAFTARAPFSRSDPVLQIGASGAWDQFRVWSPAVLVTKEGYAMWFAGRSDYTTSPQWVGYATSLDGIVWQKSPDNPVISTRPDWGFSYLTSAVLEFNGYYHLWFTSFPLNNDGQRAAIGYAQSVSDSAAIPPPLPERYVLSPNYPNPFKRATQLQYSLPGRSAVTLAIYDLLGRKIRTIAQGVEDAGFRNVTWDGRDERGKLVSAGLYVYQLRAGDFVQTRKMVRME